MDPVKLSCIWDIKLRTSRSTVLDTASKEYEHWLSSLDHLLKLPNVIDVYVCNPVAGLDHDVIRLCIDWPDWAAVREFRTLLMAPPAERNLIKAFAEELEPLLALKLAEQNTMLVTAKALTPVSRQSRIARPPYPTHSEIITVSYNSLVTDNEPGNRMEMKFWEVLPHGIVAAKHERNSNGNDANHDGAAAASIKHWSSTWATEQGPGNTYSRDLFLITCIEWQSAEARTTFLQRDDIRARFRQHTEHLHAVNHEKMDGSNTFEDDFATFLMAYDATSCQRVLSSIVRV